MSFTIGKISGQVLESNLVRQGIDLAFETDLIYLDVNNNRVGINTDIPIRPLQITGTFAPLNLLIDNQFTLLDITISGNSITNQNNDIVLFATGGGSSVRSKVNQVDGLQLDTNSISSIRSNENIDVFAYSGGQLIFNNNVEITGDVHATGDVTFDGNVIFGDNNTDAVIINADVSGNIIPDITNFYSLGTPSKRFSEVNTYLVNGTSYTAGSLTSIGGVDFNLRQGKIWFVATNGSNTNVGDHQNGCFATIEYALSNATAGDTVYIYPGIYMENFPLVVPVGVTVKGDSIRAVKIIPQASSNDQDAFLLNGETTIADLTIADFFYNTAANTGYAFRFANNITVSSRSPYIQNISVITENESSLASAGRGALIDGSVANSASIEASMLFHSATFITPNADCIVMKNGVRVEWLNSFIYFANKGLYAENGSLGFASLGLKFGAEIRSIGSANVYGNYGAWADGNQVLMYLINHNFGYIGSGLDSNNEPADVIQANEVVTLNDGKIYYQSMDQLGDYRVGDIFRVESRTGNIEFQTAVVSTSNITVTDGVNTTYVDAQEITTGNITIAGNTISSNQGNIILQPANNQLSILSNVNVSESVIVNSNTNFYSDVILGNSTVDTAVINAQIINSLIPTISGQYDLGSHSKTFKKLYGSALILDNILIDTNVIQTTLSNTDLELRANGSGLIKIDDSLTIANNLTISGTTNLSNTFLSFLTVDNLVADNLITLSTTNTFDDIEFNGNRISTIISNADLELVANGVGTITFLDNLNVSQDIDINSTAHLQNANVLSATISNLNVVTDLIASDYNTGDILIKDNFITTTQSNSNLDIRANANGYINIKDNALLNNNLNVLGNVSLFNTSVVGTTTVLSTTVNNSTNASSFFNNDILINDNFVTTTQSNSNLELRANGIGLVAIKDDLIIDSSLSVFEVTSFQNTSVSGNLTTSSITITNNVSASEYTNDDILINTNFITTTLSNSNLEFRADGTNSGVLLDQFILFKSSVISNSLTLGTESQRSIEFVPTANRTFKINSTGALEIPVGNNASRILANLGELRFNNSLATYEGRATTNTYLNGLFDLDRNTYITAELTTGINDNTLRMYTDGILQASITSNANTFNRIIVDELDINNNVISSFNSNANIELLQSGSGLLNIKDNFAIQTNVINNLNSGAATLLESTAQGYIQFTGDKAVIIPAGNTGQRLASPPVGSSRWNTDIEILEVWDGTVWASAAGAGAGISAAQMEELVDILTLVLG